MISSHYVRKVAQKKKKSGYRTHGKHTKIWERKEGRNELLTYQKRVQEVDRESEPLRQK